MYMGLFGLIKGGSEMAVARVREWFGKEYFKYAAVGAVTTFGEEFTNTLVADQLKLAGTHRVIFREIWRVLMSAIYYFGLRKYDEGMALISSIIPVAIAIGDGIAYIAGGGPEAMAKKMEMWLGLAQTSMSITTSAPAPKSQPASSGGSLGGFY